MKTRHVIEAPRMALLAILSVAIPLLAVVVASQVTRPARAQEGEPNWILELFDHRGADIGEGIPMWGYSAFVRYNGQTILFDGGKIVALGRDVAVPEGAKRVDVQGKHVYPGLIDAARTLGLSRTRIFFKIRAPIAIRTMLVKDGQLFLRSGAGIVADSDPDFEFQECESKARALVQAIDMAREGID